MRRLVILALAALLAALPAAAMAVPPDPNHTVIAVLGRRLVTYNHYGDPNRGQAQCSAQGELVDTNHNGLANAIRGRSACREIRKVTRFVLYSSRLERQINGQWQLVAIESNDALSSGQPAYVVDYTPTDGYCPTVNTLRTYRVVNSDGIRWDDGTLGTRTTVSASFEARILSDDPACVA